MARCLRCGSFKWFWQLNQYQMCDSCSRAYFAEEERRKYKERLAIAEHEKHIALLHEKELADMKEKEQSENLKSLISETDYNLFPEIYCDSALCYQYENQIFLSDGAINTISGNGGKFLIFKQEPENMYDGNAIEIYLGDSKIGYIYRSRNQDMVNDYIRRGWHVLGYINKYSVSENKATYKTGFYKPLDVLDSKTFSLIKTSKKIDDDYTRQECLYDCSVGDLVTLNYDADSDSYVVWADNEIGELPKSASTFIAADIHKNIVCVISSFNIDDNDKAKAAVTVYLVK